MTGTPAAFAGASARGALSARAARAVLVAGLAVFPAIPGAAAPSATAATARPSRGPAYPGDACPGQGIVIAAGRSIQAAVDGAPAGATFCILAGVHRLQSIVPRPGQSFLGQPGSVLSGAAVLQPFRREGGQWVADAPDPDRGGAPHGVCVQAHPDCAHPAALFLGGLALGQDGVRAGLAPGRFFFDREAQQVVVAEDPAGRMAEWSTTRHAFSGAADGVRISGLVIEGYANGAQEGAIWPSGRRWTEERLEVRDNTGVGLVVGSDGRVVDCDVHHNGELGIGIGGASGVLIRGNRVWANNTRGFDATWEGGGVKAAHARGLTLRGNDVHHNAGPGLWCDEGCEDVLIEGNTVGFNDDAGIFYEISSRGTIRDNTLRENGQAGRGWFWGADIQVAASDRVDVHGNGVVVRPGGRAIMLIDQNRRRADGAYYGNRDDSVHANRVTFLGAGAAGGVSDAGPLATNHGIIETGGNAFDRNVYLGPAGLRPVFVWGATATDFAGFRSLGQERHGRLAEGTGPAAGQARARRDTPQPAARHHAAACGGAVPPARRRHAAGGRAPQD